MNVCSVKKKNVQVISISIFLFLVACTSPEVDVVRNSTIPVFDEITIGQAFKNSFVDGHWSAKKGDRGESLVEFTGKVSEEFHAKWLLLTVYKSLKNDMTIAQRMPILYDIIHALNRQDLSDQWKATSLSDENGIKALWNKVLMNIVPVGGNVEFLWLVKPDKSIAIEGFMVQGLTGDKLVGVEDELFPKIIVCIYASKKNNF